MSETEIQPSPLILYIYKISEVKVDVPIFVAMPKLSETARKIAKGHDILIVEGSTEAPEIIEKIKTEIQDRINQATKKTPINEQQIEEPKEKLTTPTFFSKLLFSKKKNLASQDNLQT